MSIAIDVSPHSFAPHSDYMATSVGKFITESGSISNEECLHLGLTFSFPVEQTALDSGTLLTWTKGFSATGAVGQDIVQLLQDAFDRNGVQVKCVALVNDVRRHVLLRVLIYRSKLPSDRGYPACRSLLHGRLFARCHFRNWNEWCIC
jgi:hexokinase